MLSAVLKQSSQKTGSETMSWALLSVYIVDLTGYASADTHQQRRKEKKPETGTMGWKHSIAQIQFGPLCMIPTAGLYYWVDEWLTIKEAENRSSFEHVSLSSWLTYLSCWCNTDCWSVLSFVWETLFYSQTIIDDLAISRLAQRWAAYFEHAKRARQT